MQLNLPILEQLADSQNILIAGAGGGFDIFGGLPIYFTLREMGKNVHLANYSFVDFPVAKAYSQLHILMENRLVGVSGRVNHRVPYYPEGYLAQWFLETFDEPVPIWMFAKAGAAPLHEAYQTLIDHLAIDALILVDGGVDSLMRGDESEPGTFLEDTITLTATEHLNIPVKILATIGFGTETEVCHHHALENIADLIKRNAFLGCCALTSNMDVFQLYETATRYVCEQPVHAKSHINTRVISAVNGEFGNHHIYSDEESYRFRVCISPLMSLYWFFDAAIVTRQSLCKEQLRATQTTGEALRVCGSLRHYFNIRPTQKIPY